MISCIPDRRRDAEEEDMHLPKKREQTELDPARARTVEERRATGTVDYENLRRYIKSSPEEGTVARISYGLHDVRYPEGRNFGDVILLTDEKGNIGVVGMKDVEALYDSEAGAIVLVSKQNRAQRVDVIEPSFLAIVMPDGTVKGDMPADLREALADASADGVSVVRKYFYGKRVLGNIGRRIESQKLLDNK
jgi:hypothetical protein